MASQFQVKAYLAQWFQLGKKVVATDRGDAYLPHRIFYGEGYSPEFEASWRQILAEANGIHLEGTDQTIADLLGGEWEIQSCARCQMPIPTSKYCWSSMTCPCSDMTTWPNETLPKPRAMPARNQMRLRALRMRLEDRATSDRAS